MDDRPLCRCHGEPMYKKGDGYRCRVRQKVYRRRYEQTDKGRASQARRNARYHSQPHVQAEQRMREALRVRSDVRY